MKQNQKCRDTCQFFEDNDCSVLTKAEQRGRSHELMIKTDAHAYMAYLQISAIYIYIIIIATCWLHYDTTIVT